MVILAIFRLRRLTRKFFDWFDEKRRMVILWIQNSANMHFYKPAELAHEITK